MTPYHRTEPGHGRHVFLVAVCALFLFAGCTPSKNMLARIFGSGTGHPDTGANEIQPLTDPDKAYKLARHFQKQGKHRLAVEELLRVVRTDPGQARAYNALGVSYDRMREFDLAGAAYREALRIDPNLDYVYNNIGYSNLLQGNLDAAADAFQTAVALNTEKALYQNNLALANARLGKPAQDHRSAPEMPSVAAVAPEKPPVPKTQKPATEFAGKLKTVKKPDTIPTETILIDDLSETVAAEELPAAPAEIYYTIQLGVFYELDKALEELKHARETGLDDPYITKVDRRGPYRPYYRVRAGKYHDRDRAVQLASGVRTGTPMPAYVTQAAGMPEDIHDAAEHRVAGTTEGTASDTEYQVAGIRTKPVIIRSNADIEILNGNGVRHMARKCRQYLTEQGIPVGRIANAAHFFHPRTVIYYAPGYYGEARQVQDRFHAINADGKLVKSGTLNTGIRIVLGRDVIPAADRLGQLMKRQAPPA